MPEMEEQIKRTGEGWNSLGGRDRDTGGILTTHLRFFKDRIKGMLVKSPTEEGLRENLVLFIKRRMKNGWKQNTRIQK